MSGLLAANKTVSSGVLNIYTVPTGKVFEGNISVHSATNTTSLTKLTVSPTTTPTDTHIIQVDNLSRVKKGYERTAVVLTAGEVLSVNAGSADTTVAVYGILRDSSNLDFKNQTLIPSSSETKVFEVNDLNTQATCNISISLVGNSSLEKAKVKLYVTTSNVASGYILQEEELDFTNITGFERTGLKISTGYKIFVKTEGQVGNIAVRVHGYKRTE